MEIIRFRTLLGSLAGSSLFAQTVGGIAMAAGAMAISGYFLWLAQRDIPIGTAYAIWTGIGAAGTFVPGIRVFGDPQSLGRWASVALIIGGVVGLKVSS